MSTLNHVLYPNADDYKWKGDPDVAITGSGVSVPIGLEAVFSYNDLVMNDLTVYDKYRVMSIDGLADPDIRDSREDKAGDDGEDAYNSYYSGRTIVFKVRVEAYSLNKLRDMEEALRTAFAGMTEKPLYFLTGEPEKDHYINCKKSASLTKEEDVSTLDYRHFREWQITLRASDPRFYRAKKKYLTSLVSIANPELNPASGFEYASAINGYTLSSTSGTMASAISSTWSSGGTKSLKLTKSTNTYGTQKLQKQISSIQGGTNYTISGNLNFTTDAPGVFMSPATITPIMYFLDSSGTILYYYAGPAKNVGSFTLSDIWSYSVTGTAPTNATKILLEVRVESTFGYTFYLDNLSIRYTNPFSITEQAEVVNIGNYNMSPKIVLSGTMAKPKIYNGNAPDGFNSIIFKDTVTIADNNYYIIDVENKTIVDKDGVNKLSELDRTSGWLKLFPGTNTLYLGGDTTFGSSIDAQFTVEWRDAWI